MLGIEKIKIPQDILVRIGEVDEFKGVWRGLERHTTGLNMLGDFASYNQSFRRVFVPLKEKPLTLETVRTVYASQSQQKSGHYRTMALRLEIPGADEYIAGALETASPDQIAPLLEKLVNWVEPALERRDLHPLVTIAVFTAVFLQLCPFADSNLKVARFLIMILMLKAGYSYAPYSVLDAPMTARADLFYKALKENQDSLERGRPEWGEWLRCFTLLLQDQADVLWKRLHEKDKELSNIPRLSNKILNLFEDHDRLQMKEIIRLTNGRRATIKLRLNELVDGGYLKRHGQARSTWYALM